MLLIFKIPYAPCQAEPPDTEQRYTKLHQRHPRRIQASSHGTECRCRKLDTHWLLVAAGRQSPLPLPASALAGAVFGRESGSLSEVAVDIIETMLRRGAACVMTRLGRSNVLITVVMLSCLIEDKYTGCW